MTRIPTIAVRSAGPDGGARQGRPRRPGCAQVLTDKARIPRPSFPVLRRARVAGLLSQATKHRVTLVCGPAGSGKTIACASWASNGQPRPAGRSGRVAWLTAEPGDQRDWFWAYLRASLSRLRAASAAEAFRDLEDVPAERFPLRLIEAAQQLTEPIVLVIDDVHELTDPAVLSGLDLLVRHAPTTLRLVLAGRRHPPLQLARLRVAGELADIVGADLACTAEEAGAYFAMLGIDVAAGERDELLRRTEGWMAGLRLAAMRASTVNGDGSRITGLAGDEPDVTDYLWDEVLGEQQPDTLAFLLRTSIAAEVSGDLAHALTGEPGSARTLEQLSRGNSLVQPLGSGQGEYRYHPLLRDALTAELHRRLPDEVPELLRRAARWYAANGRVADAVRCAAGAGDWDLASQALAEAGAAALAEVDGSEVESVLAQFPADRAARDPVVALSWAAARLWGGDAEGAVAHLDSAGRALAGAPAAARRGLEPALAALRVLLAAGREGPADGLRPQARALAEQTQAEAATEAEHRAAGLLWFALGVTALGRWQLPEARQALRHADRQLGAGGLGSFRARARAWRALAEAWQGNLGTALRCADEARQLAGPGAPGRAAPGRAAPGRAAPGPPATPATPATAGPGRAAWPGQRAALQAARLAALAYSHVSLARDDLVTAQRLAEEVTAVRAGQLPGEPTVTVLAGLARARVLLADGDATAARTALARLREDAGAGDPLASDVMAVAEAEAALRGGDTGRARALLLLVADGNGQAGAEAVRARAGLARGWLQLADGDFAGALAAVRPWLDHGGRATLPERISALLAAAVATRRLGDSPAAAALLERALALGEPERAYRAFLDGGPAVRATMTVLIQPTSRYAWFAGRILERFDAQGPRPAGPENGESVRLTASELAVLCFLPSHMTNEEISQALFLSVNTVKTHLRSAYRKLGVSRRREAIARGRRLGVL